MAFKELKSALTNIPTLGYYDASKKTIVIADASPVGLGAVLVQVHNNEQKIIAFGSKTLTDCERRYCQTEKEALALVWAVEHFHMFLYGKEFHLITDHKPLEVIFGPKSRSCTRKVYKKDGYCDYSRTSLRSYIAQEKAILLILFHACLKVTS